MKNIKSAVARRSAPAAKPSVEKAVVKKPRPERNNDRPSTGNAGDLLTPKERTVLKVFRCYRMTPGHMLCFSGTNYDTHKSSLLELARRGILCTERFRGGYSLTKEGYARMLEENFSE